ncbi:MAG TPA: adenosine deaminase [Sphaerochaeta sp.]|nr:adenosine deaminase [Sphaerochaeta sp.]
MITREIIQQIPKVELHTHLDGGVRIPTILELAQQASVALPANDERSLHAYFTQGAKEKSLSLYLKPFSYTIAVMQSKAALTRVAFEAVEDLAADGVVYAEIRFAPLLHTSELSASEVVQAVLDGIQKGTRAHRITVGLLLCAMRGESPERSREVAQLAVAFADRGVVGFDLAGDEIGHPPKDHLSAFQYIRNQNFNITIHSGEAFGVESIWQAIQICGAHRIGHGVRLVEDMIIDGNRIEEMGSLSSFILDRRIPMEMCLSSNVDTGAVPNYAQHPFPIFFRNSFRVFLASDNRLMSDTTLSREMELAVKHYGLTLRDLEKITINAMKSAFLHHRQRLTIIYDVIKRGYADLRKQYGIQD